MTRHTRDSVGKYLNEIGRIQLLTGSEEIQLSRQIQDSLAIEVKRAEITATMDIAVSDEQLAKEMNISLEELGRRLFFGRKAKEKMVEANLRLVVSIAKKYRHRGMPFQDLIQEGTLGLIRATEKFDPSKGYKFSTYAIWAIRQYVSRSIANHSRTIRLPVYITDTVNKIRNITRELCQSLGRQPTQAEVADAMNLKLDKLRFIIKSARAIDSIDRIVGQEEDTAIVEFLAAKEKSLEDNLMLNSLRADLDGVLNTLTPLQAQVMRLRYGLDDGNRKTLQDIAERLKLSRELIRQIETKAIRQLRVTSRANELKEYLF